MMLLSHMSVGLGVHQPLHLQHSTLFVLFQFRPPKIPLFATSIPTSSTHLLLSLPLDLLAFSLHSSTLRILSLFNLFMSSNERKVLLSNMLLKLSTPKSLQILLFIIASILVFCTINLKKLQFAYCSLFHSLIHFPRLCRVSNKYQEVQFIVAFCGICLFRSRCQTLLQLPPFSSFLVISWLSHPTFAKFSQKYVNLFTTLSGMLSISMLSV